jgi:hypothetical protein
LLQGKLARQTPGAETLCDQGTRWTSICLSSAWLFIRHLRCLEMLRAAGRWLCRTSVPARILRTPARTRSRLSDQLAERSTGILPVGTSGFQPGASVCGQDARPPHSLEGSAPIHRIGSKARCTSRDLAALRRWMRSFHSGVLDTA